LSGLYALLRRDNLLSAEARLELKPNPAWDGYVLVRPLWLIEPRDAFGASGVIDTSGASGSFAGTQVDLRARHWIAQRHVRLAMGYSHLFKGRFLREAPNAPRTGDTRFGYVELTLTK